MKSKDVYLPCQHQKKKRSETRMANLLDKIRNGDHLHEDKLRKVHITWKRVCFIRNQELCHKKGGHFCFAYLPLNATVDTLSKKAIDVFFPEGTNLSGEMREHCSLRFTDSAENVVSPATQIKVYLEWKVLYLSRTYFVVYSKCDLLDLGFINSDDTSFDCNPNFATLNIGWHDIFGSRSEYLKSKQDGSANGWWFNYYWTIHKCCNTN